ncbi:MAG: peptide-methionine (S)-S-oxide reductase MsrA [Sphingopyxis sp.]|jgi:peptide-methionine (S)-S-oxide reductase|nr:peptide-methionine (S)-S-oxide reductase MsrA [Sphingopyxis sp.]
MGRAFTAAAILIATSLSACAPAVGHAEDAVAIPAPAFDPADSRNEAIAIFAGGCFWGVEGVFSHVRGVTRVVSGYHGGTSADATYDAVSGGRTNHAEAVRITYDPRTVSYGTLLRIYFSVVTDPTTLNRQGPDLGRQYRSAIIPANATQRRIAGEYIAQLDAGRFWRRPIVTRIENPLTFYRAEAEHQDFMERNPQHGYIVRWDAPKLRNLQIAYPDLYRAAPSP